jgi:hypothetical protein
MGIGKTFVLRELEAMRKKRVNERGGFKEKIFLEYVE